MSEKSPSRTVKRGRKVEKWLRMCKVNSSIQDELCGRSLTSGGNRENDVGEAEWRSCGTNLWFQGDIPVREPLGAAGGFCCSGSSSNFTLVMLLYDRLPLSCVAAFGGSLCEIR